MGEVFAQCVLPGSWCFAEELAEFAVIKGAVFRTLGLEGCNVCEGVGSDVSGLEGGSEFKGFVETVLPPLLPGALATIAKMVDAGR